VNLTVYKGDALDVIPVGVCVVDHDGIIQHYNDRASALWGRSPLRGDKAERFCGALRLYGPGGEVVRHDECAVAAVLKDGEPRRCLEVVVERPDGSRINVLVNAGPLRNPEGGIIGVINCFDEITDRHQVESQLRYQSELTTTITTHAADCLFMLDARGHATFLNPAAERTFGWTLQELSALPLHDVLHHMRPDGRPLPMHECPLSSVLQTATPLRDHKDTFLRRDGSWVHVLCSNTPIIKDGKVVGSVLVAHDISGQRRFEEDLLRAKEAAEAANAAKDQFLAALSHELRTPLAPVLMTASVLEQDDSLPERVREDLAMIRRNIELEARLIDDLLDLTRVSRGKLELHCEAVDVHVVLRDAVQTCCGSDINNKRLILTMNLEAARHFVWADAARLAQVCWNLIRNAVKFTPSGGRIDVATRDLPDGHVQISVRDTGIGIEADLLPRIFNAFEQGSRDTTRRFGGLGLGLAISKALIDQHRGRICVHSDGHGRGAVFTVELAAMQVPAAVLRPHPRSTTASQALRILLVEDHEMTARVLERLLRSMNYDVLTATTVQNALDTARCSTFDLLISDLGLPDGSGLDLMKELKQIYQIKGIALSGYGMEEDIRRSREVGFAAHLTKPVSIEKLQATINQVA
jgi:PAS domain S-box-containing protein